MEKPNFGPEFLDKKDPQLAGSPEVTKSVKKARRLGEKFPDKRKDRLNVHLERLENIFLNPDARIRERNLELLLPSVYKKFVISRENVPEAFFELQKRIARERGQAVEEIPTEAREQMIDIIITDQKHSLDNWIEYLTSNDATYPPAFKYFVFKNIVKLSQFDKELGIFKPRTDNTTAIFPDIYCEPLAQISDLYERAIRDKTDIEAVGALSRKFPEIYAELIQRSLAASIENKEEIKGQWVKYEQGNAQDAQKLYSSLENKGTGWCTAGKSTAETQMEQGDFYVYYTNDNIGEPVQPRLAIRMDGNSKIGEVRGILQRQGVEPQMNDILDEKLSEFGSEANRYKKKSADMKLLTEIDTKVKENPQVVLTKEELQFIYEINSSIEGFGYDRDPRIDEIRKSRNIKEDLSIIFECTPDNIATTPEMINENTVVYIGVWNPTILNQIKPHLDHITHLYESFPDKPIFYKNLETDPALTSKTAAEKISQSPFHILDSGEDLTSKTEFSKTKENHQLVSFSVAQLGFLAGATTDQIYAKAESLGLELCPAEVGPQLRLQYMRQPKGELLNIAMKQILGRRSYPIVFGVDHTDGLELIGNYAPPDGRWAPNVRFVFRLGEPRK